MMIKPTSTTLNRYKVDNRLYLKYHDTNVFTIDLSTRNIRLFTGGWETKNTARAMTIGLNEAGIDAVVIHRNNKNEKGLFLICNGIKTKIDTELEFLPKQ